MTLYASHGMQVELSGTIETIIQPSHVEKHEFFGIAGLVGFGAGTRGCERSDTARALPNPRGASPAALGPHRRRGRAKDD